jgi:hypothetical protein
VSVSHNQNCIKKKIVVQIHFSTSATADFVLRRLFMATKARKKAKKTKAVKTTAKAPKTTAPKVKSLNATLRSTVGSDLTLQDAQDIVVNNTPRPNNFNGPNQLLKDLGILGPNQVTGHKAGIVSDLQARNMTIDPNDITSGPGVDVATCRDSVYNNAQ